MCALEIMYVDMVRDHMFNSCFVNGVGHAFNKVIWGVGGLCMSDYVERMKIEKLCRRYEWLR